MCFESNEKFLMVASVEADIAKVIYIGLCRCWFMLILSPLSLLHA